MEVAEQRRAVEQYAQTLQRQAEFQKQFQRRNMRNSPLWTCSCSSTRTSTLMPGWTKTPLKPLKAGNDSRCCARTAKKPQGKFLPGNPRHSLKWNVAQQRLMEADAQLQRELGAEWSADTKKALRQTGSLTVSALRNWAESKTRESSKVLLDAQKWQAPQSQAAGSPKAGVASPNWLNLAARQNPMQRRNCVASSRKMGLWQARRRTWKAYSKEINHGRSRN